MSNTGRHLFIDLEDTVIEPVLNGWGRTALLNIEKVKRFIKEFKPNTVNIFSFAIWNTAELDKFNTLCRPGLEQALGIKFNAIPTVDDDIIPMCCNVLGIGQGAVDFDDCSTFWGKHEAFRLNMRHLAKASQRPLEVAFLDDAVFNENFEWPDLKISGRIINIDLMPDCESAA